MLNPPVYTTATNSLIFQESYFDQGGYILGLQRQILFGFIYNLYPLQNASNYFIDTIASNPRYGHTEEVVAVNTFLRLQQAGEHALIYMPNLGYSHRILQIEAACFNGSILEAILTGKLNLAEIHQLSSHEMHGYNLEITLQLDLYTSMEIDDLKKWDTREVVYRINNASLLDMLMLLGGGQKLAAFLNNVDTSLLVQLFDSEHTIDITCAAGSQPVYHLTTSDVAAALTKSAQRNMGFMYSLTTGFKATNKEFLRSLIAGKKRCNIDLTEAERAVLIDPPGIIDSIKGGFNYAASFLPGFKSYLSPKSSTQEDNIDFDVEAQLPRQGIL